MRHLRGRGSAGPRLHLLAALIAAFLLVPAASAIADVTAEISFAGEGAGWVKGEAGAEGGEPHVECHWNGTEIDVGIPAAGECKTTAKNVGVGEGGIFVYQEADSGSAFVEWTVEEGFDVSGCNPAGCGVVQFSPSPAGIKVKAEFGPVSGFDLAINPVGSGAGQINCEVNGTETDEPCEESYEEGAELKLIPAADSHSEFVQFENATGETAETDCTGTPTACEFTIEDNTEIDAVFGLIPHTLTVDATGEGSVSAEPAPAPVSGEISSCEEAECSAEYGESQTVTLKATPGEHKVVEWTSGCTSSAGNTCEVEIPAGDTTVEADFVEAPKGTLTVEPTGEGSVSAEASPAPDSGEIASCEEGGGAECSAEYFQGDTVTLVASPGVHQQVAWTGCTAVPSANECEVEVDGATVTVNADFTTITHTLTVTETGTGSGVVECNIDGGGFGSCAGPIDEGSSVEVKATPAAHSTFDGFSAGGGSAGGCEAEGSPCSFTLEEDSALTATFTQITHTLTVTETGTGSGVVECNIDGGGFGSCAGPIDEGSSVEVKATPAAHSTFDGFSAGGGSAGGCEAEGSPCSFTLEEDSALTATFTQITHQLTVIPTGEGSVEGGPISGCEEGGGGTCSGQADEGSTVTLTAAPGEHKVVEWTSGCTSSAGNTCEVEIPAGDATVEAKFVQATHALTVNAAGSGSGSVSCDGGPCAGSYPEGTTVTLTATAASGSTFASWSGAGCSGTGSCVVTIDAATTVTATFNAESSGGGDDNGGGGGSTPPPPADTCLTNAALCKPGLLIANPGAWVKGNKALLKVRCRGEQGARCRSTLKLIARIRVHGKKKNVLVGKSKYNLPSNSAVRVLRAKLTRGGLKLVRRAGQRGLKVKFVGKGAKNRVVKLKQQGGKGKSRHKRGGRR